jgi:hypothetical protein
MSNAVLLADNGDLADHIELLQLERDPGPPVESSTAQAESTRGDYMNS